ncbi:hypothetical protein [Hyphobacterium marinum]|uniref:Transmembrane protein n=1 Tax=Hyphobacterium marinum TaxID=3116574 RepID=A0ABU7M0W9_9PROT|nr:hypothetical protein [Hyphobacterium sp. Y6023]MEE2566910.1 hypothetical protein [Hyphobacterium sp. Y6023]
MTDATPNTTENITYRLGAWLPVGRTPRPIDMAQEPLENRRSVVQFFIGWGPTIILIGVAIGQLFPVLESLLEEALVMPMPYFIRAIVPLLLLEEYRRFCWSAKRLHDLDRSLSGYAIRRIPVWAFLFAVLAANELVSSGLIPTGSLGGSVIWGILFIVGFVVLPMGALIASFWLHSHVYRPFNAYLLRTPGDPEPNRYGPPPATG